MSQMHPNAAVRALQREIDRLHASRPELVLATTDRRIPTGVATQQLWQIDHEIGQLMEAMDLIEEAPVIARKWA